jgi:MFS family permease
MAENNINDEKTMVSSQATSGAYTPPEMAGTETSAAPKGKPWMYKSFKLGPVTFPCYASPEFQLGFVSIVCFLCPGMFNAVNGLGAGGQVDAYDINNSNTALYATFAGIGFFAGSIANRIGLRMTLGIGGFGYFLYIASILSYNHNKNAGFLIFAGALLGLCAGMLWTAQGAVMMSYPPEKSKGKYISWFWMIFNLGAVIGSLIPLGQNLHSEGKKVNDGTYIAFLVLMAAGFVLAAFLCDPKYIQRSDGSHVIVMKNPTWKSEILGLFEVLRTDWYIILLFPMFLASNWFYTYQFQDVNLAKFNIRTRALNNTLYWLCQIFGAYTFGYALDVKRIRRSVKAKIALVVLLLITMGIWGGGYAFQKGYTRKEAAADNFVLLDFTDGGYIGPMFLYMFYGFYDAAWQTTVYWFMGALTNNGRKLANFTGFYKGIQSAGAAIAANIDARKTSYMNEFAASWGLLAGSLIVAAPVIFMIIKDTVSLEEDLKFSDETFAEVAPTVEKVEMTNEKV